MPGLKKVPLLWEAGDAATPYSQAFFRSLADSKVDFSKVVMTTKDAGAADGIKDALTKAGLQLKSQK